MKKHWKKVVAFLMAAIMLAVMVPFWGLASAKETEPGIVPTSPLSVEVTTEKSKYTLLSVIEFNVRITNNSDTDIENIDVVAQLGQDLVFVKGSETTTSKDSLAPGEVYEWSYKAKVSRDRLKKADKLLVPLAFMRDIFVGNYSDSDQNLSYGSQVCENSTRASLISAYSNTYLSDSTVTVFYHEKQHQDDDYQSLIEGVDIDKPYEYTEDDISIDEESGLEYINNIITIMFDEECTEQKRAEAINSIDGEVVGGNTAYDELYIKIRKSTLEELVLICENLNQYGDLDAFFETTYDINADISDRWGYDEDIAIDWDESYPSGNEWWFEAIHALSARNYNDYYNNINIGIVEINGFSTSHEDLNIQVVSNNNEPGNHGTHVAGIIGATANNGKGITGIVENSNLYGYDSGQKFLTSAYLYDGLDALVKNGCKIVNYSLGNKHLPKSNYYYLDASINSWGKRASKAIAKLLEDGYDFVVVQSAGNGAEDQLGIDTINNGLFASITEDNCYSNKNVSKADIMNRVITVANADWFINSEGQIDYQLNASSNGGTADIAAPGTDIYSTVAGIEEKDDKGNIIIASGAQYAYMSGTSMAAPMVSGVAGLVWSVNPRFSGAEVKEIVCTSVDRNIKVKDNPASPTTGDFNLVNAQLAVDEAIRRTYNQSTITGTIKTKGSSSVSEEVAIPGTTIEIANSLSLPGRPQETEKYSSNGNGEFSIIVEPGVYDITISKLGYETLQLEGVEVAVKERVDLGNIYLKSLTENPNIPSTAVEFNGHYYQVYDKSMTWTEAKAYCENLGGHLATITSKEENDFITNLLPEEHYYIGATDEEKEGKWKWITNEPWNYMNWDVVQDVEPNNGGTSGIPQNYGAIYGRGVNTWQNVTGSWDDAWGSTRDSINGFICEWDTDVKPTGTCITKMEIVDHGQYTGNQGDSRVFHLDKSGLSGNDNRYYRNGNIGLDGTEYNDGLEVWIARWNFEEEISWAYATYKLDGKYTKLTGKTSLIKGSANTDNFDTTIYFYNGDTLLQSYNLTNSDYEKQIEVDVTGINELKILVKDNKAVKRGTSFALYDMFLK